MMRRAVWRPEALEVVEVEPGPLAPGTARLRVEACGICGSDLHFWHHQNPRPVGTAPGHEAVGTLLEGPAGLADARYAVCPLVSCGMCEYCRTGEPQLCGQGGAGIGLGRDGGLADTLDVPVANLFPVADGVGPLRASLAEPLAVCVRGAGLAAPSLDSRVLVLGAGTIGLLTALLLRDRAAQVAVTARYPHQRALAEAYGVEVLAEDQIVPWGKEHRPDVVVETVGGTADTLDVAIRVARRGARIVVLGSFRTVPVAMDYLMMKELTLVGSFTYGMGRREQEFATAVRLLERLGPELDGLLTHQFDLDSVVQAFETASEKGTGAVKVTVLPAPAG
jgi:threonine dehydrogenase-like Zn-dependent dehydrogenase